MEGVVSAAATLATQDRFTAVLALRDRLAAVAAGFGVASPFHLELANTLASCHVDDVTVADTCTSIERRRRHFGMVLAAEQVRPLAEALIAMHRAHWGRP